MKEKIKEIMSHRSVKFFLPIIIGIVGILIFQLSLFIVNQEDSSVKLLILTFAYFFPPLGKESVIPIGVSGGNIHLPFSDTILSIPPINPIIIALSVAFIDIVIALFLVWNYDLAKKIPLVGSFMEKIEKLGKSSSDKYGWVRPLRFFGIVLFVMIPFQGSGGLVGSIVGRLIGMKPWATFFAISTGAITGCLLIAYFAEFLKNVFVKNFLIGLLIFVILIIIVIMIYIYKKTKK